MADFKTFLKNYSLSFTFIITIFLTLIIAPYLPLTTKRFIYSISLTIKDILIFALPFVIFCLITNAISKLGAHALKYILIIIPLVCLSNFTNTLLAYGVSDVVLKLGFLGRLSSFNVNDDLQPVYNFHIPQLISNNVALLCGMCAGLGLGIFKLNFSNKIRKVFSTFTNYFFKFLIPIMPAFIAGTALKLQHNGILTTIFSNYMPVLLTFVIAAYGYVFLQFCILSKFNFSNIKRYLNNLTPAIVTAFGSMSSAAALPLVIKASEKNVSSQDNANIILPSIINIHLVGDCFFIPLLALTVMTSFGMKFPGIFSYLPFALHFMLAKFSVAAVPGGGVFVMFPIMQAYLGMSSDMLAIVTALYLLFDPIITVCNVSGNGAMTIIFDKLTSIFNKR